MPAIGAIVLGPRQLAPTSEPVRTPIVRYVPVSQKIATGQIVVRAKGYVR
jgi:hypothetical protein